MADKDSMARSNPIYETGKGTAFSLAHSGNKDAMAILSKIDLRVDAPNGTEVPPSVQKGFTIALESRYEISNQLMLREGKPYIIDLPSGYTPRAFFSAKHGLNYIGFDLPIVADSIGSAVKELLPEQYGKTVMYYGVDATNYASMSRALDSIDGEVCIVTDGLLGYFNEFEMKSVVRNMKSILARFGGSWITGDLTSMDIYSATFGVLLQNDPTYINALTVSLANQMSDAKLGRNSLFDGGLPKARTFLNEQGFDIEEISFADLLPELNSMAEMPDKFEELRAAFRDIVMWKLTLKEGAEKDVQGVEDEKFAAVLNADGNELHVALSGRLDTITAPELLQKYETLVPDGGFESITVDAQQLQYVSSAGLRILLIMYKALAGSRTFKIVNGNDEIKSILEMTGLNDYLM